MLKGGNTLEGSSRHLSDSDAFAFLAECSARKGFIDMTSAAPLHPKRNSMPIPSKIKDLMMVVNYDDFTEVKGVSRGEEDILQAGANFFEKFGVKCTTKNISLNNGILFGLERLYTLLKLKDKKFLVQTPTFGYYFKQFKDLKINFEILPTSADQGFLPDPQKLDEAIVRSGAKFLLLCYPNNPTGAVMTEECAKAIAAIAFKHDVFVISDEAFINNSLSEKQHFPIAAVEGMVDRSFTITSANKSVFIAKSIGFCLGSEDLVMKFGKLGGYPTKQDQKIVAAAIEDSAENREYFNRCRDYYLSNIDLVQQKLSELSQKFSQQFNEEKEYVKPFIHHPEATNVYLLDFSGLKGKIHNDKKLNSGLDIARWMLDDASVGVVPGECYLFEEETMLVRIALNHTPHEITRAFDSMILATEKIRNPELEVSFPANSPQVQSSYAAKLTDANVLGNELSGGQSGGTSSCYTSDR